MDVGGVVGSGGEWVSRCGGDGGAGGGCDRLGYGGGRDAVPARSFPRSVRPDLAGSRSASARAPGSEEFRGGQCRSVRVKFLSWGRGLCLSWRFEGGFESGLPPSENGQGEVAGVFRCPPNPRDPSNSRLCQKEHSLVKAFEAAKGLHHVHEVRGGAPQRGYRAAAEQQK